MGTDQESLLTLEWTVRPASKFNPAGIIVPGGLTVMSIDRLSPTARVPVEPWDEPSKAPKVSRPRFQPAGELNSTS